VTVITTIWNRNRRPGQTDKKKICLTELNKYLRDHNTNHIKFNMIAKKGVQLNVN